MDQKQVLKLNTRVTNWIIKGVDGIIGILEERIKWNEGVGIEENEKKMLITYVERLNEVLRRLHAS